MRVFYQYFRKIYGEKLHIKSNFDPQRVLKTRGLRSADEINRYIYDGIRSGKPFFAGRLGGTECAVTADYLIFKHFTGLGHVRGKLVAQLHTWSGFFPKKPRLAARFAKLMLASARQADAIMSWWGGMENYIIEQYTPQTAAVAKLTDFEPWQPEVRLPWSAALEGKKVLVIHPFEETIRSQYQKREKLYPGTQLLPEFELKTLKAVQTIAGQKDTRFDTWFDALEWMYREAMKIDFDVAIVGCGAYGFPLAAMLKQAGKQAIHLAGATQLLFGIRGNRWDTVPAYAYVRDRYNDAWVHPCDSERVKDKEKVEGGCYW